MSNKMSRMTAGFTGTAALGLAFIPGALAQNQVTVEQLVANLQEKGYGEIYEIERERDTYEVKARNREGWMVKLYVDAQTGEPLSTERDEDDD